MTWISSLVIHVKIDYNTVKIIDHLTSAQWPIGEHCGHIFPGEEVLFLPLAMFVEFLCPPHFHMGSVWVFYFPSKNCGLGESETLKYV